MRILLLSHYFPPEVIAPASRSFEHARAWVRAGHDVTVITCVPNHPGGRLFPGYRNRWRQIEERDGVRVVRVWTYLTPNAGFARRIANYLVFALLGGLQALREPRPDVVIATSPQFFCGTSGPNPSSPWGSSASGPRSARWRPWRRPSTGVPGAWW